MIQKINLMILRILKYRIQKKIFLLKRPVKNKNPLCNKMKTLSLILITNNLVKTSQKRKVQINSAFRIKVKKNHHKNLKISHQKRKMSFNIMKIISKWVNLLLKDKIEKTSLYLMKNKTINKVTKTKGILRKKIHIHLL